MLFVGGAKASAAETQAEAAEFNPQAFCEQLSNDFKRVFFLASTPEAGKYKFKSETDDRMIFVFHPPQSAYQGDGLEVLKTRYDNLGQGNSVYYLQVDGRPYKLHLCHSASSLIVRKNINERHVALIKAWLATFRGSRLHVNGYSYGIVLLLDPVCYNIPLRKLLKGIFNMEKFSEHTKRVNAVFSRVAAKYDVMNDLMSFGLHRVWKRDFIKRLSIKPNAHYLDISAGTGDITRLMYQAIKKHGLVPNISAVDPNEAMIAQGKAKLIDKGIVSGVNWVQAAAEELPFEDDSVDGITISFGLRNVTDREKALREFYRVLKPGGQFLCLEFSEVQHRIVNATYSLYRQHVIPRLGDYVMGKVEESPYEYLADSIQQFPNQQTLKDMIDSAGFKNVTYTNLTDGIVAIHEGWKE